MTDPLNATRRLQNAIEDEDVQLAAEAIRQGADVNALWDNQTFLSAAVQMRNAELVRLLLSAGADLPIESATHRKKLKSRWLGLEPPSGDPEADLKVGQRWRCS